MAIRYRTRGFILKKEDFGEADQIFTLYTEDFGKIKVLGRAIRKIKSKLRAGIELFSLSEIEFIQGKTYKTLTDAMIIDKFKNVRNDLEKLKIVYQITEVVDELVGGQEKDKQVWELLIEVFNRLDIWKLKIRKQSSGESLTSFDPALNPAVGGSKLKIIYYYFLWNILSILGYQVNLYKCSSCQKKLAPHELYFEPKEGGIICSDCFNKNKKGIKISSEIIKILRIFIERKWEVLKKLKINSSFGRSLEDISQNYLFYIKD